MWTPMWMIIALVFGAGLVALVMWLRSRDIKVTWYEWLIGAIGILFLLMAIQNSITAFAEMESDAAWLFLLIFGVPALILFALAWWLPWRRHRQVT